MLEEILRIYFIGFFSLNSLVYHLVESNKDNEFQVFPISDVACSLYQVFLVRKTKGSDAGQLYAMKVLKKATLKGEHFTRGLAVFEMPTVVRALLTVCVNTHSISYHVISEVVSEGVYQTHYFQTDDKQYKHFPGHLTYSCKISTIFREKAILRKYHSPTYVRLWRTIWKKAHQGRKQKQVVWLPVDHNSA